MFNKYNTARKYKIFSIVSLLLYNKSIKKELLSFEQTNRV